VVGRSFGEGRVVTFLTTLGPAWSNWVLEPSFIVVALQLHDYLTTTARHDSNRLVGVPLPVQVDSTRFRPELVLIPASVTGQPGGEITLTAQPVEAGASPLLSATFGVDPTTAAATGETDVSGVYELQLQTLDGLTQHRRFALNVDPRESDLKLIEVAALVEALEPVQVQIDDAEQLLQEPLEARGKSWSQFLFWTLLVMLVVEQLLACATSYHPPARVRNGGLG
jgi:hypothetical protein